MRSYRIVSVGIFIILILVLSGCTHWTPNNNKPNLVKINSTEFVNYFEVDGMTCIKWTEYNSKYGNKAITCNWSEWQGPSEKLGD